MPATCDSRVVMVAMDGSEEANYALHWYMHNLYEKEDNIVIANVTQVYQTNDTWLLLASGKSAAASMYVSNLEKVSRGATQILAKKISGEMAKYKVEYKFRSCSGKVGITLLKMAEQEDASLIVTGSKGAKKLKRNNSKSISSYLLEKSHLPIVVCRKPKPKGNVLTDR